MCRCASCNNILHYNSGWITLPDGSKVEESMCSTCRAIVRNSMTTDITKDGDSNMKSRAVAFEKIIEQQLVYGTVTPSKKVPY